MRALKRLGIDWKDRNLIASLYLKQTAVVRIGEELSEKALLGRGVYTTRMSALPTPL